jgi:hypothetical protein
MAVEKLSLFPRSSNPTTLILHREVSVQAVRIARELSSNAPVHSISVYETYHTGQHLDVQPVDEERSVLDGSAKEQSVHVFWC